MPPDRRFASGRLPAVVVLLCLAGLAIPGAVSGRSVHAAQVAAAPAGQKGPRPEAKTIDEGQQEKAAADEEAKAAEEIAEEEKGFVRGSGGGLAILPAAVWWLLVLLWAGTTNWAAADRSKLPTFDHFWLPLLTGPFFAVAILAWWIPRSFVALPLLAIAWLGPLLPYARLRDAKLGIDDRVLSLHHVAKSGAGLLRRVGIKLPEGEKKPGHALPELALAGVFEDPSIDAKALAAEAKAMPGFAPFRELLQWAVAARARQVVLEIGDAGTKVRHRIDGVWQPAKRPVAVREKLKRVEKWQESAPITPEATTAMMEAVKTLCLPAKKSGKSSRSGKFNATVDRKQLPGRIALESTPAGKRMVIELEQPDQTFPTLAALGMEDAVAAKVAGALVLQNGLVVVSAPPGEGLTTTFTQVVLATDRLLRDLVLIEDAASPLKEIQLVKPFRHGGEDAATPLAALEKAMLAYPTGIVVPDLRDGELAVDLVQRAAQILVIVGLRANDSIDAIERLIALGMPRESLAGVLQLSLSQRLVRKLCPNCAQDFPATPELLAKFHRPAEPAAALKRAAAEGCSACSGHGFMGRTAAFELAGGPTVSKGILVKADAKMMQKAAAKDGMVRIKDAGVAMAFAGTTSLEELQRVFKKETQG